jgi:ElaB/YqjD/DUF883 family membrane-anchored ribosome-binding protein
MLRIQSGEAAMIKSHNFQENAMKQQDSIAQDDPSSVQEKLLSTIKVSLNDAEALLREAASSTGERAVELREQALTTLRHSREALYDAQDQLLAQGRRAVRVTDEYVHDNPWQAAGVAGVAGLLIGLLLSRR